MIPLATSYDYRLVALSVLISLLTAYVAMDMAGRVAANRGNAQTAWLVGGGCAMGTGIWCMHYSGMLALRLPISVAYDVPTVVLSLISAVCASTIALHVVSREKLKQSDIIGGSVLMGAGIATMHYMGMAAMRMQAMHHYDLSLWILSVAVAIGVSFAGLMLIRRSRNDGGGWKIKSTTCVVIGLAIPIMHYTGMAAVSFVPMPMAEDLSHSINISSVAISAVIFATLLILGFSLVSSLVDRRMFAQHAILEGERAMLRTLIDNVPDFMYVKDLESKFVVANAWLAQSLGAKNPDEVLGKTDFDFFPKEQALRYYQDERLMLLSGLPLFNQEEINTEENGNKVSILTTKVPLRDHKGLVTGIAGVGRNISERRRSEDALRETERKYRGIVDEAIVGIFQVSLNGEFLSVNPFMATTLGYPSALAMTGDTRVLWRDIFSDPKRCEECLSILAEVGRVQNFEYEVIRKDGSKIWLSSNIHAVYENGAVVRHEGMSADVTERKLLRDQLFQSQKLESVGQLAAGIAHEINTPTQYIGDNVRFLKDTFQDLAKILSMYRQLGIDSKENGASLAAIAEVEGAADRLDIDYLLEEAPKAIDQALEGVGRVSTLVGAMKEFSHPGTKEKVPLELNHAIQSTITVARNEWKYVAELETDFDPDLPLLSCLPGQFNQVILNLVVNAAHAIADTFQGDASERGIIRVRTKNCEKWAEIRVEDTGCGIPESARGRIFDPFYTTKEIGKGTGQGLAIARSVIVDKHGGSIEFESNLGVGTTFIIRLPHDGQVLEQELALA